VSETRVAVSDMAGPQRLPRYQYRALGRRVFSVAVPTVWNSFPDEPRDPTCAHKR